MHKLNEQFKLLNAKLDLIIEAIGLNDEDDEEGEVEYEDDEEEGDEEESDEAVEEVKATDEVLSMDAAKKE